MYVAIVNRETILVCTSSDGNRPEIYVSNNQLCDYCCAITLVLIQKKGYEKCKLQCDTRLGKYNLPKGQYDKLYLEKKTCSHHLTKIN